MPTSNEYRKKAEECYRLANEAKTETDRLACLDLARNFLDAAARQEEMTSEQIAAAQKPEGQITEVSFMFPKPGTTAPAVPKISFVTRAGDLICGVGYYK